MDNSVYNSDLGVIQTINERHSVRSFDQDTPLAENGIEELLELATKAPSAWNLQHWKFLVFDEEESKEKLFHVANSQMQVKEAPCVIAILGDLEANLNADDVYEEHVKQGMMTPEIKEAAVERIQKAYAENEQFARDEAMANASLAAMQLMLAVKAKGYDSVPMGGFDRAAFISTFQVPDRYVPVMLIAVGKAAQPGKQSARRPLAEKIVKNSF